MFHHLNPTPFVWSFCLVTALLFVRAGIAQTQTILMFVSHEDTYYTEAVVMKEALEAAGYAVEVRSASTMDFSFYMVPFDTDIEATANSLPGSNYEQFRQQFASLFGAAWDESMNAMPGFGSVDGAIQDITDFTPYAGLVIAGGTGVLDYRVDGTYSGQGAGERQISAAQVEAAALALNELAIQALLQGKPVMAQCHGASIPAFWRIPDTSGPGEEALGYSLLKDGEATGYPEPETPITLNALDIAHREEDRVTVSNPHGSLADNGAGTGKIITTRDWYPQTIAYAARTFLNVLETYPSEERKSTPVSVLVLHGGAVDENDCAASNRENDVPCNHGTGVDLPADFTDVMEVLQASGEDGYSFDTDALNLSGASLPFVPTDKASVASYLESYDVVIFFKHWSTSLTDELLSALVDFTDDGGGLIGLHHALYNDQDGGQNKDILVELFGAQSTPAGWAANLTSYNLYSTNHGHFISTYLVDYGPALVHPGTWDTNMLPTTASSPYSTLPAITIYDELYENLVFTGNIPLGRGTNQITPLFSNDQAPSAQAHTSGFTRAVDMDENGMIGRAVYLEIGERQESFNAASTYGQMVRNAVMWASPEEPDQPIEPATLSIVKTSIDSYVHEHIWYINTGGSNATVGKEYTLYHLSGRVVMKQMVFQSARINLAHLKPGVYLISDGVSSKKVLLE